MLQLLSFLPLVKLTYLAGVLLVVAWVGWLFTSLLRLFSFLLVVKVNCSEGFFERLGWWGWGRGGGDVVGESLVFCVLRVLYIIDSVVKVFQL